MELKPRIRNEDRFAYRAGELAEISAETLALLRSLYPDEEDSQPGRYDAHGNQLIFDVVE